MAGGECADVCQHCPPSDNARPCAASAASLVTFTKPVSDRNVRMVCNIWKEQREEEGEAMSGRAWGGAAFRKGRGGL